MSLEIGHWGICIMPGKVNPVIRGGEPGRLQVVGNDLTVTIAAEAGQLQLNVMEPIIALNILLQSLKILTNAIRFDCDRDSDPEVEPD